jgi:hypothetical protein
MGAARLGGIQQRRVGDGPPHGALNREIGQRQQTPFVGHGPRARAEADHPGPGRGGAERAARVRPLGQRHHGARQRRRRAAGRSPRRSRGIERVGGRPVDPVGGVGARAEFRRVGLAQDDRPGLTQTGDLAVVGVGHMVLEQKRAVGRADALDVDQVLDADRQAEQFGLFCGRRQPLFLFPGHGQGTFFIKRHEGVDRAVHGADAFEAAFHKFHRRQLSRPDQGAQVDGGKITRLGHCRGRLAVSPRSQNSPPMRRSAERETGSRMCSLGACCEQAG